MRFPGWFGPTLFLPWSVYVLVSNPIVLLCALSFGDSARIAFSTGELLIALSGATALSMSGAALMAVTMNPSHRQSFFGR